MKKYESNSEFAEITIFAPVAVRIIERAKTLIRQSRWADALAFLQSLKDHPLSLEHTESVQSLTQQARQGIAASNQSPDQARSNVSAVC
jgi:hypothetical protein